MALAQIILRRGTSAEWATFNPVLAAGEFGYDTTSKRAKVGDGQNVWATLAWITMSSADVTRLEEAAKEIAESANVTDAITAGLLRNEQSSTYSEAADLVRELGGGVGHFQFVEDPANKGFLIFVSVDTPPPAAGEAPEILTTALGPLTVGVPLDLTIQAKGDIPISFFLSAGTLPAGLTLAVETGRISGTPTAAGAYDFTVTATNPINADTQQFTGTIVASGTAPAITGPSSVTLTQGVPASVQLTASGSDPKTWSVSSGSLPAGLSLNVNTGVVSGTPTASGPFSVGLRVTNPFGNNTLVFTGSVAASTGPVDPGTGTPVTPTDPGTGTPVPGGTTFFGPNGTHYPTRTPWVGDTTGWDSDVEVDCTWEAIRSAVETANARFLNGKCRIRVRPGALPGYKAGATNTPVLQDVGVKNRASRIVIVPRDGAFTVTHSADARLNRVRGVSFVGFCPWGLGVSEANSKGLLFTNCEDFAWAWSKTRFINVQSNNGYDSNTVELVEVVAPEMGWRDDDRMANRNADDRSTRNLSMVGCYITGTYQAAGSDGHTDTFQTSGSGEFTNMNMVDTVLGPSTNAVFIVTPYTDIAINHCALLGGYRALVRFPLDASREPFGANGPIAINGAPRKSSIKDSIVTGKIIPTFDVVTNTRVDKPGPTPKSGSWTVVSDLLDTTAKINAEIPIPTDARLQSIWAAA